MKKFLLLCFILGGWTMVQAQTVVSTFDRALHTAGATISENFSFPEDNSNISQIVMRFELTCPAGGCDPWDRYAHIQVEKNGLKYEIGRYITPYGNGNCEWSLDVTEYRDLLTGDVKLLSHIETWQNGWDLTVDFDFVSGTPNYSHVKVDNLWQDYRFIYGDTIFKKLNLEARDLVIPSNAEKTVVRIVHTGHGQGNTDNAAEFAPKTHDLVVNGQVAENNYLWKDDCNINPCSPQAGTWQFARAGWCPGQEVAPTDYDITSLVTPGQAVSLDYVLEPFFNFCSPWNPDCQSGTTCANCVYDGNGHTEPHYKMSIQLLNYGNSEFTSTEETVADPFKMNIYPNPSKGNYRISINNSEQETFQMQVVDLAGRTLLSQQLQKSHHFVYDVDLSEYPSGTYFLVLSGQERTYRKMLNLTN